MTRTRRRVSRALIGILAVTLVLALIVWLTRSGGTEPAEVVAADAARLEAASVDPAPGPITPPPTTAPTKVEPAIPAPARTMTPTIPSSLDLSDLPTTRPGAQQLALATPQPAKPVVNAAPAPSSSQLTPPPMLAPQAAGTAMPSAQELIRNGKLLEARDILNAALDHDQTTPQDADAIKNLLAEVNDTVVFGPQRFANDAHGGSYTVKSGDLMSKIAANHDVTWELLCRINNLSDPRRLRAAQTIKVLRGPFHALVDKSDFKLEIWLGAPEEPGSMFITRFDVGLGENDSTPTGTWIVETDRKIKNPTYYSPRGEGVIDKDDPSNPLGEFWIGLAGIGGNAVGKESYGIHGTIEPDSIGKQQSMGCIRLRDQDIAKVYELLVEGQSTVVVRE